MSVFGTLHNLIFGLGKGEIVVGTASQSSKLPAGTNGQAIVYDSNESLGVKAATIISDTAYDATSWNTVIDVAPSKNAVRDVVELLSSGISGCQPLDSDLTSWAAITRASGFDTFATTPSSANLAAIVTDETGSGALVFGTGPAISGICTGVTTVAAGSNGQGQGVISAYDEIVISSVVSNPSGSTLPAAVVGKSCTVYNSHATNVVNVYPASGHSIDALAANASVTLNGGRFIRLCCDTAGHWKTTKAPMLENCALVGMNSIAGRLVFRFSGMSYSIANEAGTAVSIYGGGGGGTVGTFLGGDSSVHTSLTFSELLLSRPFAPTSGTGLMNWLIVQPTINQTGGSNGITRGILVNPTLTNAYDFRGIEIAHNTGKALVVSGTAQSSFAGKVTFASTVKTPQTYSPSAAGTATLDCNAGDVHRITMPAGNITIALSNVTNGQTITIAITQDGTGSRTVTWFSTIKWAGGSAPTLTTTANKRDIIIIHSTGTGTYDGAVAMANV